MKRLYLMVNLGPVCVEEDEKPQAKGEDEEAVPGQEEEEGLEHPQEHSHVDVALGQLGVHSHLTPEEITFWSKNIHKVLGMGIRTKLNYIS